MLPPIAETCYLEEMHNISLKDTLSIDNGLVYDKRGYQELTSN